MKEVITRPILFNSEMVRAILDGRKTETRRPLKKQPPNTWDYQEDHTGLILNDQPMMWMGKECWRYGARWGAQPRQDIPFPKCPLGQVGDRLWIRETVLYWSDKNGPCKVAAYRADGYELEEGEEWTPSIHMFKWASRITLEITEIRIERVHNITPEDAMHEGVPYTELNNFRPDELHKGQFADLWDSLYKNWDSNPWVWVVKFKMIADVQ